MKLEMYLDMTGKGDSFEKVMEFEDTGQWGPTRRRKFRMSLFRRM